MSRALVAAAAALAGVAVAQVPPQCFPEYQCIFHRWTSNGKEYSWDFGPLCRGAGSEYSAQKAGDSSVMSFNLCGTVATVCAPQLIDGVDPLYSHGVAVQFFEPGYNPNGQVCDDVDCIYDPSCPQAKQKVPCTGNCEVVAHYTAPMFSLADPINSDNVNGGVNLTFAGVPAWANDPFECPTDLNTMLPAARQLTVQLFCDKGQNGLAIKPLLEPAPCQYVIQATTKYACPTAGDPFDHPATPGRDFGLVVLGSVLTVVVYGIYVIGDGKGWWDPIKARLPACNIPGLSGRGGIYGGSYKSVSGASATAPSATPISASAYGST